MGRAGDGSPIPRAEVSAGGPPLPTGGRCPAAAEVASVLPRQAEPSGRQLALCDWLVLATNVPASRLSGVQLWVVYRCRWQVELLWKRCKSQLG